MTTLVKICGLRDRATVNAAVAAGADAVGFVFAESVRRTTPQDAVAASAEVPAQVLRVAVMLHPSTDEWQQVARILKPDVLQTDLADFAYLDVADDVIRWPVIRENSAIDDHWPETFVYEGEQSGSGETVDWQRAAGIARRGQMILAGGLNAHNVGTAIAKVAPYGVDVSSAVESAPGEKDLQKIGAFISAARRPVEESKL